MGLKDFFSSLFGAQGDKGMRSGRDTESQPSETLHEGMQKFL